MKPLLFLLLLLPCSLLPAQRFFWGDSTVVETPDSLIVTGFARDSIFCFSCHNKFRNKAIKVDTTGGSFDRTDRFFAPFVKYSVHKKTGRGALAYYRRPLGSLYDNMESLNGWVLEEMTETRKRKPVGYYTELSYGSSVYALQDGLDSLPRIVNRGVSYRRRKRLRLSENIYFDRGLYCLLGGVCTMGKYVSFCRPVRRKYVMDGKKYVDKRRVDCKWIWEKPIFKGMELEDMTEAELLQLPEPFRQFVRAQLSPDYWARFWRLDSLAQEEWQRESVFKPPRCAKEFVLSDSLRLCFEDKSTEDYPCSYGLWVIRKWDGYISYHEAEYNFSPYPNTCMSDNYDLSPNRRYFVLQCYNDHSPLFFLVIDLQARDLVGWIEPDEDVCGGYWNRQNEWIHQGKVLFKGE